MFTLRVCVRVRICVCLWLFPCECLQETEKAKKERGKRERECQLFFLVSLVHFTLEPARGSPNVRGRKT